MIFIKFVKRIYNIICKTNKNEFDRNINPLYVSYIYRLEKFNKGNKDWQTRKVGWNS